MKKVGFIVLAIAATSLFMSCSSSKSAGNGYFGVSNKKARVKQQKEFAKPKHKIQKAKGTKKGN